MMDVCPTFVWAVDSNRIRAALVAMSCEMNCWRGISNSRRFMGDFTAWR